MDSTNIFLLDRINRMIRIVSRFPDETVKITSAYRRKTGNHTTDPAVFYTIAVSALKQEHDLLKTYFAKRIDHSWFHPEAGYA